MPKPAAYDLSGQAGFAPLEGGGLLDYSTAQTQLAEALKFDPNAKLERLGDQNSPIIGADQGPGYTQFKLDFDKSKLPKFAGAGIDASKYGGWRAVDPTGENKAEIAKDPRYVIDDPNYGEYTFAGNLKANPADQMDPLWKGIDMAARLTGSALTGGMAGLVTSLPGAIGSATSGGGMGGIEGAIMGILANMSGVPGAGTIMSIIMQQLQNQKQGGG